MNAQPPERNRVQGEEQAVRERAPGRGRKPSPPASRAPVEDAGIGAELISAAEKLSALMAGLMAGQGLGLRPFEVVVTGASVGEIRVKATGGAQPEATFSLGVADAWDILTGDLSPSVAFMRGVLKTAGDPGLVLDVLAWSATDTFASGREALVGIARRSQPTQAMAK